MKTSVRNLDHIVGAKSNTRCIQVLTCDYSPLCLCLWNLVVVLFSLPFWVIQVLGEDFLAFFYVAVVKSTAGPIFAPWMATVHRAYLKKKKKMHT